MIKLKLYLSLSLALIAGIFTLISALINGVRLITISYRLAITMLVFGTIGFVAGRYLEFWFLHLAENSEGRGRTIDIALKADQQLDVLTADTAEFKPFNPNNLERISPSKR